MEPKELYLNLRRLLEIKYPCQRCPAETTMYFGEHPLAFEAKVEICKVCRGTVGLESSSIDAAKLALIGGKWCPCHVLGPKEAAKRAWLFLEERGLLEEELCSIKNK